MEKFNLEGGGLVERGEGAGHLIERRILIEDLQYMLLGYFFVIFILNLDLANNLFKVLWKTNKQNKTKQKAIGSNSWTSLQWPPWGQMKASCHYKEDVVVDRF